MVLVRTGGTGGMLAVNSEQGQVRPGALCFQSEVAFPFKILLVSLTTTRIRNVSLHETFLTAFIFCTIGCDIGELPPALWDDGASH